MSTTVDASVDEYRRHLGELYEQIRDWLREAGFACEEVRVAVHEERSGQYDAPGLIVRRLDGEELAELAPIGADILGAEGRVDLRGALDSRPILYLLTVGPTLPTSRSTSSGDKLEEHARPLFRGIDHEGWYTLADEEPKSVRALYRETFLDLLKKVADDDERK